ncbi:MAG: AAA family ATPase [Clostridiales bacterium]|nr:AAA family ATPase [Clostridiales bacterium]
MKRYALDELIKWKTSKRRKPLILKGARQVGKTWLMKYFGENYFENMAYIDFYRNERMKKLFSGDFEIRRLIEGLQAETHEKISPDKTLIVFDEVQEVPLAISSLKYFYENSPEYAIIAGGSLLGVASHKGVSFPVGKVEFANLYPLNFCEFLEAIGESELVRLLMKKDWQLIAAFKSKFIDYLRKYYFIGGMPESVAVYSEDRDYIAVRKVQEEILTAYNEDFSKHVPSGDLAQVRNVWNNITRQLAREKKRFSPGIVKKNSRLKDYENALQWLTDAGLIYKVEQISIPSIPLKNYTSSAFKIYFLDVGLLSCMAELDSKVLLEGAAIFKEFKGSLTENYVCQELINYGKKPFYWSSEATAEVGFVFKHNSNIYPLEAKAEENLKAKSLKVYKEKFKPALCLRTSMKDYREEGWLTNIPLYAIGLWEE